MSNPFCAAGFHLPDGQWATFGGNAATTRNESQVTGIQDWQGDGPSPDYGVTDGRQAIRIVKPYVVSFFQTFCTCLTYSFSQMHW